MAIERIPKEDGQLMQCLIEEVAKHVIENLPLDRLADMVTERLKGVPRALPELVGAEMEPFFAPSQTSQEVLRLLPLPHKRKWTSFFSDWGCLRCGRGENEGLSHGANGFCVECRRIVASWLLASIKKRAAEGATITSEEAILRHRRRPLTTDELAQFTPETILEPWFLPKPVEIAITQLVPISKRRKWVYFFIDHGCLRCERTDRKHHCLGFCKDCYLWIHYHLGASIKRHLDQSGPTPEHLSAMLTLRASTAQRILAGEEVLPIGNEPEQEPDEMAVYDAWKRRLGRGVARMIDVFLSTQGELSTNDLATKTGLTVGTTLGNLEVLRRNTLVETRYGRHMLRLPCEKCRQFRQTLFAHRKPGKHPLPSRRTQ